LSLILIIAEACSAITDCVFEQFVPDKKTKRDISFMNEICIEEEFDDI